MKYEAASVGSVLVVSGEYPPVPGGIGAYSHHLIMRLHHLGVNIQAFCARGRADAEAARRFDETLPFPIRRYPRDARSWHGLRLRVWQTTRLARACEARCLVSSGRRATWVMARVARATGLPFVAIGYGSEFLDKRSRRIRRTRRAFRQADRVVAISRFTAELMARAGVASDRIRVIHPGAELFPPCDTAEVERLRRRLGLVGKRVILTVGRVSPRKAQDLVIRALPEVLKVDPLARYLIVGQPDYREAFQRVAQELGVTEQVIFTGAVAPEALAAYYALCDVFILNSRLDEHSNCEGFGIVFIEAGLAGKPVIGTRHSGAEDAVVHGETGLLVEPDERAETARALIRLLREPEFAQRLGAQGYARAAAQFTWDRVARDFKKLLDPWLTEQPAPA